MRFRPRYSLLTLLLLVPFMALIVGGAKLWFGPNLVVERRTPEWELRYSFIRDWHGNRFVDGPVIHRRSPEKELEIFYVRYFRKGVDTKWLYCGYVKKMSYFYPWESRPEMLRASCPLTEEEMLVFEQACAAEWARLAEAGFQEIDNVSGKCPANFFDGVEP